VYKMCLTLSLLIFCVPGAGFAAAADLDPQEPSHGVKALPGQWEVDKKSENVNAIIGNLKFCLEKVTPETIGRWEAYAEQENKYNRNGGNQGFKMMIEAARKEDGVGTWIATVRKYDVSQPGVGHPIEMFFAVRAQEKDSVIIHHGISRSSIIHLGGSKGSVPRDGTLPPTSLVLHGFSATAMQILDPAKEFLRVAPIGTMEKIMYKDMPPQSLWIRNAKNWSEEEKRSVLLNRPSVRDESYPPWRKGEGCKQGLICGIVVGEIMACRLDTLGEMFKEFATTYPASLIQKPSAQSQD